MLVEKPVSVTVAEIEEMAARADAAGLVCMPGHNYIYEDGVRRAGELIAGGALGRLDHDDGRAEVAQQLARVGDGLALAGLDDAQAGDGACHVLYPAPVRPNG